MSRKRASRLALALSAACASACTNSVPSSESPSSATLDTFHVWAALLKGFEGPVRYVGSDDAYAYFQVQSAYYKIPLCAVAIPQTHSLGTGESYVVRFHVDADNTVRPTGTCTSYDGQVLGRLDQVESR